MTLALPDPTVGGPRKLHMLSLLGEKLVFLQNGPSLPHFFVLIFNWLGVLQNLKSNSFQVAPSRVILTLTRRLLHGIML
jgi:hypothetical protein